MGAVQARHAKESSCFVHEINQQQPKLDISSLHAAQYNLGMPTDTEAPGSLESTSKCPESQSRVPIENPNNDMGAIQNLEHNGMESTQRLEGPR